MKRILVPPGIPAQDLIPLIAHDLRSPVTAIKGFCQLALRQHDLSPGVERYVSTAVDEANHIARLLDDLVLVADLDAGTREVRLTRVNLRDTLHAAAAWFPADDPECRLELDPAMLSVEAWADPFLVERAVVNLISVGLKYCRKGDVCKIGAKRVDGTALVWITPSASSPNGQPNGRPLDDRLRLINGVAGGDDELRPRSLSLYLSARLAETQYGQVLGDVAGGTALFLLVLPTPADHPT